MIDLKKDEYYKQVHDHDISIQTEEDTDAGLQLVSDAKMVRLARIIKDLRTRVPISAEAPGEKTQIPDSKEVGGQFSLEMILDA